MPYYSETDKARELIDPKYLQGKIIDIGCGEHPLTPDAIGVDGRDLPQVKVNLKDQDEIYCLSSLYPDLLGDADIVYSSHCLEHLRDDFGALMDWTNLLKQGGYLILYLPDGNYYSHENNWEHMRPYNCKDFVFWFERVFCGHGENYKGEAFKPIYELIDASLDIRPDCYSFLIKAKKL